jgi:hypothetical protein
MSTNVVIAGTNTASNLVAASNANGGNSKFLPQMWKKGAELSEQNEDFFQEFEGKGKMSPVRVETDFTKGAGQKIVFRNRSGLYGDGGIGDESIGANAEEWNVGEYELEVDFIRHNTEWNKRTEEQTGLQDEISSGMNEDLGAWLGRKKTKHLSMMFRERLHATSQLFAGAASGVGSINAIKTAHTISVDEVIGWGTQLGTMGGKPAQVDRDANGNPIRKYILVAVTEALVTMKRSSDYKQMVREAQSREKGTNPLFKGGYVEIDGHIIKEYNPLDHDGRGAIGSAMNGKALLGEEITAANTVQDIKGGGNATNAAITTAKYFEFFPLYAYRFTPADTLSVSAGTHYCLIYNLSGADAHKMGFYSFNANNGNKLTMVNRLRAAASGAAVTTLGGVTWNTGVWLNKHTDAHPAGSVVIHTNSYGVPIGCSFMLGADAAKRGYGKYRNHRSTQTQEGGFFMQTYITSVFGQTPTKRTDGRTPNALRIYHAIKYAGLPAIPDVS